MPGGREADRVLGLRPDWSDTSFLGSASDDALRDWAAVGEYRSFGYGTTMIVEGERDDHVFLLLTGMAKVTAELGPGRSALLAVRVGGDLVGEVAASDGDRRLATVRVCSREPVTALVLGGADFTRTTAEHPAEALRLSAVMGAKLRSATRRRVDISGAVPLVRLARVLVELGEDHGTRLETGSLIIGVNLTQLELGTLIGVAEITAQRALRELRQLGLIAVSGRRPIVRDWDGLQRIADSSRKDVI